MGQSLGVCFGRSLVVYDVKNCENPGEIRILLEGVGGTLEGRFKWKDVVRNWKVLFIFSLNGEVIDMTSVS